jgi:hypothetical protein
LRRAAGTPPERLGAATRKTSDARLRERRSELTSHERVGTRAPIREELHRGPPTVRSYVRVGAVTDGDRA